MEIHLSHNNPCFQCNIAITNFLVSRTCEIRFNDIIGQSNVPLYSYAKMFPVTTGCWFESPADQLKNY